MTIKQIAEFAVKDESTVRRWAKKAAGKMPVIAGKMQVSSPANPADYSVDEVEHILNESRLGQNAVLIIMANARNTVPSAPQVGSAGVDYAMISQIVAQAVTSAVTTVIQEMNRPVITGEPIISKIQLPAPIKANRDQLRQILNKYADECMGKRYRDAWHVLYEEIYYRLHINVKLRAENAGVSKLDYIEQNSLIDPSISIIQELMGA